MAEVGRLKPFEYLEMIGSFAERFGLDPDLVYQKSSFETVTNFLLSWRSKLEFDDRFAEVQRLLNEMNNGNATK